MRQHIGCRTGNRFSQAAIHSCRYRSVCHSKVSHLDFVLIVVVWWLRPTQSVLVHSDQVSQYGSDVWKRFCDANNLEPSISRRGNCSDNAVAKSFTSSLKQERICKRIFKTRVLPERMSLTTLKGFKIAVVAIIIWAASVLRYLNVPQFDQVVSTVAWEVHIHS